MGELTPLDEAVHAVIGLAKAEQQRTIAKKLRDKADEYAEAYGTHSQSAWALNQFALQLEEELA
jgi:hypothetical protein